MFNYFFSKKRQLTYNLKYIIYLIVNIIIIYLITGEFAWQHVIDVIDLPSTSLTKLFQSLTS